MIDHASPPNTEEKRIFWLFIVVIILCIAAGIGSKFLDP